MSNVVVIPARAGSKGIPSKNERLFNGKMLVEWSIIYALNENVGEVIVSSDSTKILSLKDDYPSVTFLERSELLSSDEAKTIDVLNDIVINHRNNCDYVVLLQPTSPLRVKNRLREMLKILIEDASFSAIVTGYYTTIREYGSDNNLPRQSIKPYFYDDGNIYIFSKGQVMMGEWCNQKTHHIEQELPYSLEIDNINEFKLLEAIYEHYS